MRKVFLILLMLVILCPVYSETIRKLVPLTKDEYLDYTFKQNQDLLTIYKTNGIEKQIYLENNEA